MSPTKLLKYDEKCLKNDVLVTSRFTIFRKNDKCLKHSRMYEIEVKRNSKTSTGVKWNGLQYDYIRSMIFFDFDLKNSIFWFFSKTNPINSNIFQSKNEIYVISMHKNNTHTKFQSSTLIFDSTMVKKEVTMVTSLFRDAIFVISYLLYIKGHFWNSETELDRISMCV